MHGAWWICKLSNTFVIRATIWFDNPPSWLSTLPNRSLRKTVLLLNALESRRKNIRYYALDLMLDELTKVKMNLILLFGEYFFVEKVPSFDAITLFPPLLHVWILFFFVLFRRLLIFLCWFPWFIFLSFGSEVDGDPEHSIRTWSNNCGLCSLLNVFYFIFFGYLANSPHRLPIVATSRHHQFVITRNWTTTCDSSG